MHLLHRILTFLSVFILAAGLVPSQVSRAGSKLPYLLKDINDIVYASDPAVFYPLGNLLYFGAVDARFGRELWRTDGTQAGTWMVKDINPGVSGSLEFSIDTIFFGSLGTTFYFAANDSAALDGHGVELWKTDGTPEGTVLVKDINPSGDSSPKYFTTVNNLVFFYADEGEGYRLWQSDGSPGGTIKVSDMPLVDSWDIFAKAAYKGFLYFGACDAVIGCELWRTDGTPEHFELVADINPTGDSLPNNLGVANDTLFFSALDGVTGTELWKTNGIGAALVKDINLGSPDSYPSSFISFDGKAYFYARTATEGSELWRTDGSEEGTELVKDINIGTESSVGQYTERVIIGNQLFFQANDSAHGIELWKTDGEHTQLVADLNPGEFGSNLWRLTPFNGILYFTARNLPQENIQISNYELWRSDGSASGTYMVKDITPGPESTWDIYAIAVLNNHLYFRAKGQLWSSDGTEAGTQNTLIVNQRTGSANIQAATRFGSKLFFTADDGVHGREPWITDGTSYGTKMIKDVVPGSNSGAFEYGGLLAPYPMVVNNRLFFIGKSPDSQAGFGPNLWITDGTDAGSQALTGPWVYPSQMVAKNNEVFFIVGGDYYKMDLMKSNGTTAGTVKVKTWGPDFDYGVRGMSVFNGLVYFHLDQTNQYNELWQSDGTDAGTIPAVMTPRVDAIYNHGGALMPDGRIFYWENYKLWQLDSSGGNKQEIPGNYQIAYGSQAVVGDWLYFMADPEGAPGFANLYRTQGAASGVELLVEGVHWLEAVVNEHVYFTKGDPVGALWLGRVDNSSNTPLIFKPSSGVYNYRVHDGLMILDRGIEELYGQTYFITNAPGPNIQLWVSDGSAEGTHPLYDLGIGITDHPYSQLTTLNGRLLFISDDGIHNREWTVYSELDFLSYLPFIKR